MKIYTKTGDKGETSLIGGTRVPKYHDRIDAYGTVDELISYIGLIRDQEIDDYTISFTITCDGTSTGSSTPGFEIVFVICAITLILFLKRRGGKLWKRILEERR